MLCLYCSQVSHIPPIFTMELFGKPPWWADGACREENKAKTWALYTAHTFLHFQASFCKREQQRSSGNLTMGLFWKTRLFIGAFLYAAATVNTVDTGDWRLETGEEHQAPTCWNDFNHFDLHGFHHECNVFIIWPLCQWNKKTEKHLNLLGKLIYVCWWILYY